MTTRAQQLAVLATCLLAAMTNAGAVTTFALATFLLPGVLIAAAVGGFFAGRRMPGTAFVFGGLVALGWSELVNVWSGNADGPVARATVVATVGTLVAVVAARSSSPGLFLIPTAGSVCGALLLGAGSEVRIVAVATAVAAVLTLGSIERSRRNWSARSRRGPAFVLVPLLVGAAATAALLMQVHRESRQPEAIGSGLAYPGIKPPWTDPLGTVVKLVRTPPSPPRARQPISGRSHPPHETTASKAPTRSAKAVSRQKHSVQSRVWLYVLAGIVALVGAVALRLLTVRLRWARLRRRLATGAVAEQITGAWTWTRLRLEACRLPLGADVSPDLVASGGAGIALPATVFASLTALATSTTTAAFAPGPELASADVSAAWTSARQTEASARELLTSLARVGLAFRGPGVNARGR